MKLQIIFLISGITYIYYNYYLAIPMMGILGEVDILYTVKFLAQYHTPSILGVSAWKPKK